MDVNVRFMVERWRDVVGYEGLYEVSDQGRIRSVDRTVTQIDRWGNHTTRRLKGRLLKPGKVIKVPGRPGYLFVKMPKNTTLQVHRAVLEAFVGPCPPHMTDGCHKDDNSLDNRVENLEWGTRAHNKRTAVANGIDPNVNKTHCKHGHEFTPENTIARVSPNGRPRRACRECRRKAVRECMRRRRAANAACQP